MCSTAFLFKFDFFFFFFQKKNALLKKKCIFQNWIKAMSLGLFRIKLWTNICLKDFFPTWIILFSKLDCSNMNFPKLDYGCEFRTFSDQPVHKIV